MPNQILATDFINHYHSHVAPYLRSVHAINPSQWENHTFIQKLLPTRQSSQYNSSATVVSFSSDEVPPYLELCTILNKEKRFIQTIQVTLAYWGIFLCYDTSEEMPSIERVDKARIKTMLGPGNHNALRFSRFIESMAIFFPGDNVYTLLEHITKIVITHAKNPGSQKHWEKKLAFAQKFLAEKMNGTQLTNTAVDSMQTSVHFRQPMFDFLKAPNIQQPMINFPKAPHIQQPMINFSQGLYTPHPMFGLPKGAYIRCWASLILAICTLVSAIALQTALVFTVASMALGVISISATYYNDVQYAYASKKKSARLFWLTACTAPLIPLLTLFFAFHGGTIARLSFSALITAIVTVINLLATGGFFVRIINRSPVLINDDNQPINDEYQQHAETPMLPYCNTNEETYIDEQGVTRITTREQKRFFSTN